MLTEGSTSTRLDDNDVHSMSTSAAAFDNTNPNYTHTIEDNQITGNQGGNVLSGKY